jgi:hypothetical protein
MSDVANHESRSESVRYDSKLWEEYHLPKPSSQVGVSHAMRTYLFHADARRAKPRADKQKVRSGRRNP